MRKLFQKIAKAYEDGQCLMLLTVIKTSGSTPCRTGNMMLVSEKGRICGTIGGGALENTAESRAKELLGLQRSSVEVYNLENQLGMQCGGVTKVLFSYIDGKNMKWKDVAAGVLRGISDNSETYLSMALDGQDVLVTNKNFEFENGGESENYVSFKVSSHERAVIFGAGHIAMCLAPLLKNLDFHVVVYDPRKKYANRNNFPGADEIITEDFDDIAKFIHLTGDDYAVVITSGHAFDYEIEKQLLPANPAYIGVIGSKKKTAFVNEKLLNDGFSKEQLDAVHSPIGLKINAETTMEIAVSIAGELISERALRRSLERQSL